MGQRSERRERVEASELENRIIGLFETNQALLNINDIMKLTNQARVRTIRYKQHRDRICCHTLI
jgi:hypothetical protein